MNDLARVLAAFQAITHCEAALWVHPEGGGAARCDAATDGALEPPRNELVPSSAPRRLRVGEADLVIASIPGPRRAWLVLGPCAADGATLDRYLDLVLPVVTQYLQSALEVEHAANELAERYEEINLLYTISEILGRTVSLEEAARTILGEVSETVGARRAAILVLDRITDTLRPVAVLGADAGAEVPPIPVDDTATVSARVFRTQHAMLVEGGDLENELEAPFRRGSMLSVPIMWTAPLPRGAEPLGVVNLSDRRSGLQFTAGDQKLMSAIATQVGTAIQNARLVRASVEQQRLAREMQLAHELQMKLLPSSDIVAPEARVSARVMPAESVGGDFYNLFRLGGGCTGVMIGDVSGHGYQAALIMALTMSASAIHAQTTSDPGESLHRLFNSLREELATTEMYISAFYGVIDPTRGELRYGNNGHPHAFVLGADGSVERLAAQDPPLGMTENRPATTQRPWRAEEDLLLLFTDGISDARNRAGERLGEQPVLETAVRYRAAEPRVILSRVFDVLDRHMAGAPRRDDLTLVVLKS